MAPFLLRWFHDRLSSLMQALSRMVGTPPPPSLSLPFSPPSPHLDTRSYGHGALPPEVVPGQVELLDLGDGRNNVLHTLPPLSLPPSLPPPPLLPLPLTLTPEAMAMAPFLLRWFQDRLSSLMQALSEMAGTACLPPPPYSPPPPLSLSLPSPFSPPHLDTRNNGHSPLPPEVVPGQVELLDAGVVGDGVDNALNPPPPLSLLPSLSPSPLPPFPFSPLPLTLTPEAMAIAPFLLRWFHDRLSSLMQALSEMAGPRCRPAASHRLLWLRSRYSTRLDDCTGNIVVVINSIVVGGVITVVSVVVAFLSVIRDMLGRS